MITDTQLHFLVDPPFPPFPEIITELGQDPADQNLFAVIKWLVQIYGYCYRPTEYLARLAKISSASAASSRHRLVKSGWLQGDFVTEDVIDPVWMLTVPQIPGSPILGQTISLHERFAEIDRRLASGDWVHEDVMVDDGSQQSAIMIWDAVLSQFKTPWQHGWRRILIEGIVPLGVRWNTLFVEVVTQECYQWLESSRFKSLYVMLRATALAHVDFIDFNLGVMPVGMLPRQSIRGSAGQHRPPISVNGRPICGFCGSEGLYPHTHLPFRDSDLRGHLY